MILFSYEFFDEIFATLVEIFHFYPWSGISGPSKIDHFCLDKSKIFEFDQEIGMKCQLSGIFVDVRYFFVDSIQWDQLIQAAGTSES